jgi:hypothetical protein
MNGRKLNSRWMLKYLAKSSRSANVLRVLWFACPANVKKRDWLSAFPDPVAVRIRAICGNEFTACISIAGEGTDEGIGKAGFHKDIKNARIVFPCLADIDITIGFPAPLQLGPACGAGIGHLARIGSRIIIR